MKLESSTAIIILYQYLTLLFSGIIWDAIAQELKRICTAMMTSRITDNWARTSLIVGKLLLIKASQGYAKLPKILLQKRKPSHGYLTFSDKNKNAYILFDWVIFEIFFDRLCSFGFICIKWKWDICKYKQCFNVPLL